jgi:hypothetical protein
MNLLPYPRSLKLASGTYKLPRRTALHLDAGLPRDTVMLPLAARLQAVAEEAGVELELVTGPAQHPQLAIRGVKTESAPAHAEGYRLRIGRSGVLIEYREVGGLRAALATLRQIIRECGSRLPCLIICDHPDFSRRGVMLDISRGKVPKVETLMELTEHLADFKINEFQLYIEHTFAYRNYEPVWRDWGALTGEEILKLDAQCRLLGIDLVPNQNSFGHLRYWLEYPPLKKLAETKEPYEGFGGLFLRYPSTLAPNHPGTMPFLRELYDELLPNFTSRYFNVGCDETWDLGRGRSKDLCERAGKGPVYFDFVKKIHREVTARGRQMLFWGDIILHYPELIGELPQDVVALNWGYEANHPFDEQAELYVQSKLPFYVCPGTSTWMTLIGRHDNAFANLHNAASAGLKHGAVGYLNTDWGDGGHPQPLAVSYAPYLVGAALSWCGRTFDEKMLVPVLSRDVFDDPTQKAAQAALAFGFAHRKFDFCEPNVTPFGATIAAPPPEWRELVCRNGLKYYARISEKNIRAALEEIERQRVVLNRSKPADRAGQILAAELDFAGRMAAQSCHYMLWQQTLAAGKGAPARRMAKAAIRLLRELDEQFNAYWPLRNKGTTQKCSAFLRWRTDDYRRSALHFPPDVAGMAQKKTYAAE